MRNLRTLFIVGAGASKEVGFPVGKELIDIVALRLDFRVEHDVLQEAFGDADIADVLQQRASTRDRMNELLQAAWRVRDGVIYANSIDTFIDVHRGDPKIQLCGKLAIVKTILEAERQSPLSIDPTTHNFSNVVAIKDTWLFNFARNLNDGVRKEDVDRVFEKVSFVVFNYDRSFEHFMYHALQRHFGIDQDRAREVMGTLDIVHPYGVIADLPWQSPDGIPFGFTANRANLEFMAERIKTFTEQIQGAQLPAVRQLVQDADTVVFLGFSYHPENMRLLNPHAECMTQQVFGTALQIPAHDVDIIRGDIRGLLGRELTQQVTQANSVTAWEPIYLRNDLTCAGLLHEYSRSLFAAGHQG